MTFLDKVRLMRDCLPEAGETSEWKDMLVIIFRVKDRRCLQQKFTHHLLMAKLKDDIWRKVVQAGKVTEKFYRNVMRMNDEVKIESCIDTLLVEGPQEFKIKVKQLIDEEFVRSKKAVRKWSEESCEPAWVYLYTNMIMLGPCSQSLSRISGKPDLIPVKHLWDELERRIRGIGMLRLLFEQLYCKILEELKKGRGAYKILQKKFVSVCDIGSTNVSANVFKIVMNFRFNFIDILVAC